MTKPSVTGATHTLPFGQLSALDFERLCLALLPREGFARPRHLGAAGGEQGRDIVARRDGALWYVQCKRVERCGPQVLLAEVKKIEDLITERPDLRPAGLLFMVSRDVSATAEEQAAEACKSLGLTCEVWARTDLDWRVQKHLDLKEQFFQVGASPEPPVLFTVPFPRNEERFVGREVELAELHRLLQAGQSAIGITPAGISGMGGIGKTRLAVEYAYQYHDAYPGGVFWINAARVEQWNAQLVDLADRLGLKPADPKSPDRTGQMVASLSRHLQAGPKTLVIFDNVVDPSHLQTTRLGAGIRPAKLGGTLLFTTRRREMPGSMQSLDLRVLPRESSHEMLLAARPGVAGDPSLDPLCAALGDLPLALKLAAAALENRPRLSLASYLEKLAALGAERLHKRAKVTLDDYYAASLTPALQTQWAMLAGDDARLLLRVAGQLGEAELIPVARLGLLADLHDDEDGLDEPLSDALRELEAASLIEELVEDEIRLHPLVREFAARQTPEDEMPGFRGWCAANLADAYNQFALLQDHCARRGIDALQGDLFAALDLLPAQLQDSIEGTRSRLRGVLRLLQREAHNLRGWNPEQVPTFFAQQIHNRAATLGPAGIAEQAAACLDQQREAYLLQQWRAGSESLALERTLTGHQHSVSAVVVTPDGQRAVSASRDGTLKVWDLTTGEELTTLQGHEYDALELAVTSDGQQAVSAFDDGMLKVWDLAGGEEMSTMWGDQCWVSAVALTPDGWRAVSIEGDEVTLRVWDLASDQALKSGEKATLRGHEEYIYAVAVTPDGRRAVSASEDRTLKLWDLASAEALGSGEAVATLRGHAAEVIAVAVTADGRRAVSGSDDGTLKLWDLASAEALGSGEAVATLRGHIASVRALAVTADGRRAVSGSDNGTLKVWDLVGAEALGSGEAVATLRGHVASVRALAVTPDGRRAVSASEDHTLKVWDLARAEAVGSDEDLVGLRGLETKVTAMALTPDGRRAVSGSYDDVTLEVWDLASAEALGSGEAVATLRGHKRSVYAVVVTPDGRRAVSGSDDGTLKVWDLASAEALGSGEAVATLRGAKWAVRAVAVTADGRRAVSGSDDGTLKVWDLASAEALGSGEAVAILHGHGSSVSAVAVTPDGRRAVSGFYDGTLHVWDLASAEVLRSGEAVATLRSHKAEVTAVAVTPDGRRAVSASRDGMLKVWDLASAEAQGSGEAMATLRGHEEYISAVAVTPDGDRAVSGSYDQMLRVWNLDNGKEMAVIALDAGLRSVTIAPDGVTILAGYVAGNVYCLRYVEPPGTE